MNGVMAERHSTRILDEFDKMGLRDKQDDILKNNAARLLGITF